MVMITERFSFVRYFAAARCTSAAVIFCVRSVIVFRRLGSL